MMSAAGANFAIKCVIKMRIMSISAENGSALIAADVKNKFAHAFTLRASLNHNSTPLSVCSAASQCMPW